MSLNPIPSARELNEAAKARRFIRSAETRKRCLRKAAVVRAEHNRCRNLSPAFGSGHARLTPQDRLKECLSFEGELENAFIELDRDGIYEDQKERARLLRTKMVGEDEPQPLDSVILNLISRPEYRDLSPRDLWPLFFAILDRLKCRPIEYPSKGHFRKTIFRFNVERSSEVKYAQLTFGGFETKVRELRKATQTRLS